ncbi:uncharacterized protein LOC133892256 [Phragmites australis]|uniref:uncharacterized protein LOC133892256 n=1 Tax=Phragmites australis TaxID=29695 RepID=UPI002D78A8A2|nr:uncharacterized protein LOC133892256 [Phragmites australis]
MSDITTRRNFGANPPVCNRANSRSGPPDPHPTAPRNSTIAPRLFCKKPPRSCNVSRFRPPSSPPVHHSPAARTRPQPQLPVGFERGASAVGLLHHRARAQEDVEPLHRHARAREDVGPLHRYARAQDDVGPLHHCRVWPGRPRSTPSTGERCRAQGRGPSLTRASEGRRRPWRGRWTSTPSAPRARPAAASRAPRPVASSRIRQISPRPPPPTALAIRTPRRRGRAPPVRRNGAVSRIEVLVNHPLQVVAIAVFNAFFVPFLGTKAFQIVAMAIYKSWWPGHFQFSKASEIRKAIPNEFKLRCIQCVLKVFGS